MDRPALARLLLAVEVGELDCVVVYKLDRLSRSLLNFTRMLSVFEKHKVSFVAVTQQFNTSTSLGRLTLNIRLCARNRWGRCFMRLSRRQRILSWWRPGAGPSTADILDSGIPGPVGEAF